MNKDFDSITKDLLKLECVKGLEDIIEWKSRLFSKIAGKEYFERVKELNNYLAHTMRVARWLYERAPEDIREDCTRAAILHDVGKVLPRKKKSSYLFGDNHPTLGAEFSKKLGENDLVVNAIRRHKFPRTFTIPRTRVDWWVLLADRHDHLKRDWYALKCLFC